MSTTTDPRFTVALATPVDHPQFGRIDAVRVLILAGVAGFATGYRFLPLRYEALLEGVEPSYIPAGVELFAAVPTPTQEAAAADIAAFLAAPVVVVATAEQIKAEAQRRILLLAPTWRQSNMIAHTVELVRDNGTNVAAWPAPAQAANAAYQAIWDQIKAIRAVSNALELTPPAVADLAASFDAAL